jgi:lipoyl(octanoyl) transferase
MSPFTEVVDFGLSDYNAVYAEQKRLVTERLCGRIGDRLLVGEHPHVVTVGRGTRAENLLAPELSVVEIERGGDVTYHGPGQLIAYPIRYLAEGERDLHRYLRNLEEVLIRTLDVFGVAGYRRSSLTGVWVVDATGQARKIASIGVAVKKWVTYHGLALNVGTDLDYFRQINPCGLASEVMISLQRLCAKPVGMAEAKSALIRAYGTVFDTPIRLPEAQDNLQAPAVF